MAKQPHPEALTPAQLDPLIKIVRGQRVMLDPDLARVYGVPTYRLNEQVARNKERFPADFAFQLTRQELADLKSQTVISKTGRGGRQTMPWVFTEHGVAMLSSVLRSSLAVQMNIEIVRAFVRVRRLLATPGELVAIVQQLGDVVNLHDKQLKVISEVLQKLLAPPPKPDDGRRIGFHANNQPEPPPAPAGRLKGVTR